MAAGSHTTQAPSWEQLREQAVAAVKADIARIQQRGGYRRLTTRGPVPLPSGNHPLVIPIPAGMASVFWKEQEKEGRKKPRAKGR